MTSLFNCIKNIFILAQEDSFHNAHHVELGASCAVWGYLTFSLHSLQGALVQWLKLLAWKVGDASSMPALSFKKKVFLPRSLVKIQFVGSLRDEM